jgi:predicted small secreted protein
MFSVFMVLIAVFYLSACNTMAGVGKDIQRGGEALENAAD